MPYQHKLLIALLAKPAPSQNCCYNPPPPAHTALLPLLLPLPSAIAISVIVHHCHPLLLSAITIPTIHLLPMLQSTIAITVAIYHCYYSSCCHPLWPSSTAVCHHCLPSLSAIAIHCCHQARAVVSAHTSYNLCILSALFQLQALGCIATSCLAAGPQHCLAIFSSQSTFPICTIPLLPLCGMPVWNLHPLVSSILAICIVGVVQSGLP